MLIVNYLDKQYQELLFDIIENGVDKDTRNGKTRSVFGKQIRHKMSDGFPLLTTKKLHFKSIVTELLWFLRGDTNIRYLVDNGNTIWVGDAYKAYTDKFVGYDDVPSKEWFIEEIKRNPEFAQKFGNLGPIYGKQWRKWKTFRTTSYTNPSKPTDSVEYIDQIANLINDLKTNPDSRRLMVNAWNVGEIDQMVLPPCHYGFQVYTRELSLEERRKLANHDSQFISPITVESWDRANIPTRAISLMWNQRSVDTFLGLPFNIASYGLLLEIIAKLVNMVPDELIGNLGDTHLYLNHIEQAKEQISREPYPLPKLILDDWYSTQGDLSNTPKDISEFLKNIHVSHIRIDNYQPHPSIKAPLSN
jgi:thymidylate synthase